jgi:GNAT superfamily N-acetyltransferase
MLLSGRVSYIIYPMDINLIDITHKQVTPEILALFDITKPTMPRAFNVLEGLNRGQILVDDPEQPTSAVVRDSLYGTLYFGGNISAGLIESLVQYFRGIGEAGIGCWLDDPLNEIIPKDFDYDGRTYYFTERSSGKEVRNFQLPAGYTLRPRDEDLFRKSFDFQATLDLFGPVGNALKHTLGAVILHGDTLVCEAATGAPTHGLIEVGVTTAEPYRGKGFATLACARLIQMCEEQGYKTWWDCAKQNTPSIRLAKKLGYQNELEYRYVWWTKK